MSQQASMVGNGLDKRSMKLSGKYKEEEQTRLQMEEVEIKSDFTGNRKNEFKFDEKS